MAVSSMISCVPLASCSIPETSLLASKSFFGKKLEVSKWSLERGRKWEAVVRRERTVASLLGKLSWGVMLCKLRENLPSTSMSFLR